MVVAICFGVFGAAGLAVAFAWAGAEVLLVFAVFAAVLAAVAWCACAGWTVWAAVMVAVTVPVPVGEDVAARAAVAVPPMVPMDIRPAAAKPAIRVRLL